MTTQKENNEALLTCGHCQAKIPESKAEGCWYCGEALCYEQWESVGHCGHPEAEAENERARKVPQP